jgi:hypothetical protein
MTTTTSYGTWFHFVRTTSLGLRDLVDEVLGEHFDKATLDAVETDYRAAINAALPEGVSLAGNEFYGPHPLDWAKRDAIADAVESVDIWAILGRRQA